MATRTAWSVTIGRPKTPGPLTPGDQAGSSDVVAMTRASVLPIEDTGLTDTAAKVLTSGTTTLLATDFASLTTAAPISLSDFRTAMGDANVAGTSNLVNSSVATVSGRGKVFRQHFPGGSSNFDTNNGIKTFVDQPFTGGYDEATITYDVRLGADLGGGGKLPGLGGILAGHGNPPTGGSPSPYGWSGRAMWLKDQYGGNVSGGWEFIGYIYDPTQPSNNYGQNRHTSVAATASTWVTISQYYKMNSVASEGVSGNADGIHRIWINGSLVYSSTTQVYRIYAAANITHMLWHNFYGGATSAWYPASDADTDFDNLVITTP